jgi:uncharacterized coiled-coil DUF342 family protein
MSELRTLASLNAEIIALGHQRDALLVEVAELRRERDRLRVESNDIIAGMRALKERLHPGELTET